MGYTTITAKIKELIDTIEELEAVYDHNPNTLGSFPAATITAAGHKNRFNDTASNIRSYQYLIRVYYRLDQDDDAETIVQDITDKVITQLEANVTVAGVWDIARPTEAVYRTGEREVPVLVSEITAIFEVRVNRNV